jgi:Domain of unknown function (DUF222)
VASEPFPGLGQDDGDQPPPPGGPAWDGPPWNEADDDWDADADFARFLEDPGAARECFAEDMAGDTMRPGPLLLALAEQAALDPQALTSGELLGVLSAARRVQNRAEYLELTAIAEFSRRRAAELADAKARKVPRSCRPGEFADHELALQLTDTAYAAGERMELATALATRLPQTFAGMAAGLIDGGRAATIGFYTQILSDEHAAHADQVLAAAAPDLRYDQLSRKAAALEMRLDPEGVKRRKEDARKEGQRVEARREPSGNMSYAGRELAAPDVLGAKASIDADAAALRNGGLAGSLDYLRSLAFLDRLTGRNPLDRLTGTQNHGTTPDGTSPTDGATPEGTTPDSTATDSTATEPGGGQPSGDPAAAVGPHSADYGGYGADDDDEGGPGGFPACPGTPAGPHPAGPLPLPALINLIVPAGLLFGWSGAPADAGGWGLLDGDDTRQLIQAASRHPRTRWCVTLTGPDGTAIAHGCAHGQHPWTPAPASTTGHTARDGPARPGNPRDGTHPSGPYPDQAAQLAQLLQGLNTAFAPIAKGSCDHKHREDRYTPSRTLKHLVRARNTRCTAPGCGAQAYYCDLDHTVPWPDGMTCECDLGPKCRRHHRCKQAPGWRVGQPEPGVFRWTTPSGRSYTSTPTVYDQ